MIAKAFMLSLGLMSSINSIAISNEPEKVFSQGDWSKPVTDSSGYGLRGRLVVSDQKRSYNRREVLVFIELQEVSDFVGSDLQLYCDLGKTDFLPEYKEGLRCQLLDADKKEVKPGPFPFGGGTPKSMWATLPKDASIRLRATPFTIHREKAMAISAGLEALWVIEETDTNEYFLTGRFVIDPAKGIHSKEDGHVWRGEIV